MKMLLPVLLMLADRENDIARRGKSKDFTS